MTAMQAARDWVYSLLVADVTLTNALGEAPASFQYAIYSNVAPNNTDQMTAYPLIVTQFVPGGQNVLTHDGDAIAMYQLLFMVKVSTAGADELPCLQLMEKIEAALQGAKATFNGYLMNCTQIESIFGMTLESGKQFRYGGGIYRVRVRNQNL